jgi:hypothetical protein
MPTFPSPSLRVVQSAVGPRAKVLKGERPQVNDHFGLPAALSKRVADGELVNVFIATRQGIDRLIGPEWLQQDAG